MARREYPIRETCAEPGCRDQYLSYVTTQRDYKETKQHYRDHPYRCMRHSEVAKLITPTEQKRTCVLVARKREGSYRDESRYWHVGDKYEGSYVRGPGHLVFADDFPEGTVLVITAEIGLATNVGGG